MSDPTTSQSQQHYKRVMLKISGESLMGKLPYGIDPEMVGTVAHQVKDVVATGIEVCLVIGGGNIFRGVSGAPDTPRKILPPPMTRQTSMPVATTSFT